MPFFFFSPPRKTHCWARVWAREALRFPETLLTAIPAVPHPAGFTPRPTAVRRRSSPLTGYIFLSSSYQLAPFGPTRRTAKEQSGALTETPAPALHSPGVQRDVTQSLSYRPSGIWHLHSNETTTSRWDHNQKCWQNTA